AAITGLREVDAVGRRAAEVLPAWEELTRLAELADSATPERARPVTVPIETPSGDRWVAVTGVEFDEGVVYALRDVSDEHAFEQARSDFVATASHELRTPLAAVYGAARTLLRTDIEIPADQHDRFLEIIASETERLTTIVSQILLAGQLEEGRVDVATTATDLRPLVESVLDSTRVRAPEQIDLRFEQNGDRTVALANEDKLRQVLVNLLDNAIKYSPDGGDVVVELEGGTGRVRLAVRDHGLGIPQGEQERIFEKFYRLDPALTRGVGGSGLGLFISRELISRMGGSLTVPLASDAATFTEETLMLVLVADDDRAVREALERALELHGYEVALASDGDTALTAVDSRTPDALVLDVMMPGLDGLDVTRRLRRQGNRVPILLLTARDAVGDRVEGLDAGADDYLPKPYDLEELLARLRALLRRSKPEEPGALLRFADLTLDLGSMDARRGGRRFELTTTEAHLLELFMRNPRQVLPRSLIYERVWGYDFSHSSNALDVYVGYLRRKTEAEDESRLIHTVRGTGYVMREP
ncbi:MAG: response regulator, partial [Actinobacteria bacterium]